MLIAENPEVIHAALNADCEPLALLREQKHIIGDTAGIVERCNDMPICVGEEKPLATLAGYTLTRDVLCAMCRRTLPNVEEVYRKVRWTVVIEGMVDATNIGATPRSAAALGVDAMLLTCSSYGPLNRRAIRVSMDSVSLISWTWLDGPPNELRKLDFRVVAIALAKKSISIDNPILATKPKLAIVMGAEKDGPQNETIDKADYVAHVPMVNDVNSLSVTAASVIAFWQLRV